MSGVLGISGSIYSICGLCVICIMYVIYKYMVNVWCVCVMYSVCVLSTVCAVYEFSVVCICVCVRAWMFLVNVDFMRIGALCVLHVYMYCVLGKCVLDVWCVCDKCVVCEEHMQ